MNIDLSSIAKGYGVDKIAELLEARGITDYLVEIGGDMRVNGQNKDHQRWRIAVEEPTPGKRQIQKIIHLKGQGIATSGDYRNFFEHNGRRYSHIINPNNGWPVEHQLASVTVISENAMQSDALATALLVLGSDKGYQLAQANNIAALFITHSDDGFVEKSTDAFQQYLRG